MRRITAAAFVLLACSACLRSTTTISVRPDGSGTLLQETGLNPQALAMLKGMAASTDKAAAGTPELLGEEQAKKAAALMGVRFVSGEPIKTADLEGYRARYAFDDIRTLQVRMNQDPTTGGTPSPEPPFAFEFERRPSSSVLTITVPEQTAAPSGALPPLSGMPSGAAPDTQANAQAIQMMKLMMRGLFVDISLAVDGRIVKTNAPHVSGSQITLLQLDFDKLLADEAALQKLQGASSLKALAAIPGLKVVTDRKVTIEFAK